jgi:DNA-binding CsgD family transcriptional regulator
LADDEVTRTRQVIAAQPLDRRAFVQVLSGAPPTTVAIETESLSVGRSRQADLRFDVEGVSRMHARIVRSGPAAINLVDLGAKNGTYVNGARVDIAALHHGDRIQIGPVLLAFSLCEGESQAPRPVAAAGSQGSCIRAQLSEREWEVAINVAHGLTNVDIARALGISRRTVATHLERIYARLEIHSRAALANLVAREGSGEPG